MASITIHKRNATGQETWAYDGIALEMNELCVKLEARFNVPGEHPTDYTVFRFNDRFVEWFYSDRWYNVMEVHDVHSDHLKGWYCNITRPALITPNHVYYDDLALDLWVDPDGSTRILDEDEFVALRLDPETQVKAWEAIEQIRMLIDRQTPPFDQLSEKG